MIITLSDYWREKAIEVGKQRQASAIARNAVRYGVGENLESYHISGANGEAGVAKHFRLPWDYTKIGGIDVGGLIEVRSRPIGNDLPFRPKDHPKRALPYVLVWMKPDYSSMELKGWLYGHECMHEDGSELHKQRWNAKSGCWYNPPPYRPLDELIAIVDAQRDKVA